MQGDSPPRFPGWLTLGRLEHLSHWLSSGPATSCVGLRAAWSLVPLLCARHSQAKPHAGLEQLSGPAVPCVRDSRTCSIPTAGGRALGAEGEASRHGVPPMVAPRLSSSSWRPCLFLCIANRQNPAGC